MSDHSDGRPLLFSVVVPVFNCREYIGRCIESVVSQDYGSFELIVVDDGSTDDSYEICSKYSAVDRRVKTIKKENGGPFSARLAAYPHVVGDYVLHIDADDALAPWALSRLAEAIAHQPVDVVFFEFSQDEDFGSVERRFPFPDATFFGPREKAEYLNLVFSRSYCLNSMCSKAIKADLLKGTEYPPNMQGMISGEDLLQSLYVLNEACSAYYLGDALYYYRENPTGTTSTFRYSDLADYEVFYRDFRELLRSYCTVPGFALTETDNDRSFIFGSFRFLQNAARRGAPTFSRAADIVRNSKDLADALRNASAKKGLRLDASLIIPLVLGNSDRLAYVLLSIENRLHELSSGGRRRHDGLKGDTDDR